MKSRKTDRGARGAQIQRAGKKIDAAARDRYVAREARAMRRLRDEGHRDWISVSDQKIDELAEALGRIYEHHFRK